MSRGRAPSTATTLRCAVYTRKSSEEGLEQEFNSLHAQREACEAYIRSQVGEGWSLVKTAYDDGGFSGGNIERPGLKRLLADVAAKTVDVVVVYKVDRLTRSLSDFAKIVDVFDGHGVSFVSVTQAFNTTTSMGRLTLNVLLSFAQFEREVTGERIRDKIAASKAKGIWMGGMIPLGYDVHERTLIVNDAEAERLRSLFARYLALRSLPALKSELDRAGVRSKSWVSRNGRPMGGARFTCGGLAHLLQNRLYRGELVHKGEWCAGRHSPIVDATLFGAVQAQLTANRVVHRRRPSRSSRSPLTGLLLDASGGPMSPTFAYGRKDRRYRYYASAAVLPGRGELGGAKADITRVAADPLESLVLGRLRQLLERSDLDWAAATPLLVRVQLRSRAVEVVISRPGAVQWIGDAPLAELQRRLPLEDLIVDGEEQRGRTVRITIPVRPMFRGGRTSLTTAEGNTPPKSRPSPMLVRGLRNAHQVLKSLGASPLDPLDRMAGAVAPEAFYARRTLPLGFLAPDIQKAILTGRQPAGLTLDSILGEGVPTSWEDQRRKLGFTPPPIP